MTKYQNETKGRQIILNGLFSVLFISFFSAQSFANDEVLFQETIRLRCSFPVFESGLGRVIAPDTNRIQNYVTNRCLKLFPGQNVTAVQTNNAGLGCRSTEQMKTPHITVNFSCVGIQIENNESELSF
jgi:hypothetical protein